MTAPVPALSGGRWLTCPGAAADTALAPTSRGRPVDHGETHAVSAAWRRCSRWACSSLGASDPGRRRRRRPPTGAQEVTVVGVFSRIRAASTASCSRASATSGASPMAIGARRGHRRSRCRSQNVTPPRPLTHDLFLTLFGRLNVQVTKVVITDLRDDIYYATLSPRRGRRPRWSSTRVPPTPSRWPSARRRRCSSEERVFEKAERRARRRRRPPGRGSDPVAERAAARAPAALAARAPRPRPRGPAVGDPAPHRGRLHQARREVRRSHRPRRGDRSSRRRRSTDIGGLAEAKAIVRSFATALTDPELYRKWGITPPKGMLLYGPPGHRQDACSRARSPPRRGPSSTT